MLSRSAGALGTAELPSAVAVDLADCSAEITAARLIALECARGLDRGEPCLTEMAMARAVAVETCSRVYDRCMQAHGTAGIATSTRLFDGWHQARIVHVAGGGTPLTKRAIARELLAGSEPFVRRHA
jgi:acyl-CoA dehydrogenase